MICDFLRSAYSRRMRFVRGNPSIFATQRWYRCSPSALPLPFPSAFGSANWDDRKKTPSILGDDATVSQTYSKGQSLNSSDGTTWAGDPDLFLNGAIAPGDIARGPDGTPLSCKGLVPLGTPGHIAKFDTPNTVDDSSILESSVQLVSAKRLQLPASTSTLASLSLIPGILPFVATLGDLAIDGTGRLYVSGNPVYDTANPPPSGGSATCHNYPGTTVPGPAFVPIKTWTDPCGLFLLLTCEQPNSVVNGATWKIDWVDAGGRTYSEQISTGVGFGSLFARTTCAGTPGNIVYPPITSLTVSIHTQVGTGNTPYTLRAARIGGAA